MLCKPNNKYKSTSPDDCVKLGPPWFQALRVMIRFGLITVSLSLAHPSFSVLSFSLSQVIIELTATDLLRFLVDSNTIMQHCGVLCRF